MIIFPPTRRANRETAAADRKIREARLIALGFTVRCAGCGARTLPAVAARAWRDGRCQECLGLESAA